MKSILLVLCFLSSLWVTAQQVADLDYVPPILQPEYQKGAGSVVIIDEGHHNFHTKEGRYKAFTTLLERDGYVVKAHEGIFTKSSLEKGKILVISNALNESNVGKWYVPTFSAFTDIEIDLITQWVEDGGSLFLIADHMPMGGAAKKLAAAFGYGFTDGFAMDTIQKGPSYFKRSDNSLRRNSITKGRNASENVKEVASFTGQAFRIPTKAKPILVLNERFVNKLPDTAWVFDKNTRTESVKGWAQGAYSRYGKGRIVLFGEAAMFTAQVSGANKHKMGMNREDAKENYQLLLNIIHWLDRKFD